ENTHYIAFVDTKKLLEHPDIGPRLIDQLSQLISLNSVPDVLLVPNRPRGRILANMLSATWSSNRKHLPIVIARRPRRRPGSDPMRVRSWYIRPVDREMLYQRSVLVVDAAAGHGTTIDRLTQLASDCQVERVSA